ncbi:MAG TPA: tyrosine-type recombinase/integrase [Ktedonobacteraceae bacterium]
MLSYPTVQFPGYIIAHDAGGHSKYTMRNYRSVISRFLQYMTAERGYTTIDQIEENDILEWLADLRGSISSRGGDYSPRTIQSYCRDVIAFFHWLVQHGHLEVNPVAQIREPKVDKPLIRVYTDEDLRRLDAACDRTPKGSSITPDERKALAARDRAIIWLFLSTGIRASELCGLLFSDIDWDAGLIYVRGKGAKERRVPFGKVARQHLNTYIQYWRGVPARNEDEHVFLNVFGIPMRLQSIQQLFKRLKKVSGITDKRVSAHTCRHWFAVNCIKRGMPSTVLQGLLGHEHLEMINVYVKLAEQDSRALYVQYSPVDALEMHHSAKGRREQAREWRNARKRKGANK